MSNKPSRGEVLACRMGPNRMKAATVGDYFLAHGRRVWLNGQSTAEGKDWRFDVIDALLAAGLASSASGASVLVAETLNPVVDDPDLPGSLQGKTAPSWWDSNYDPFADEVKINACCDSACDCGVMLG